MRRKTGVCPLNNWVVHVYLVCVEQGGRMGKSVVHICLGCVDPMCTGRRVCVRIGGGLRGCADWRCGLCSALSFHASAAQW
jgi:hypothetical protein